MNMNPRADVLASETARREHQRRARRTALLLGVAAVIIIAGVTYKLLSDAVAPAGAPPLAAVTVAVPLQRDVTEWDNYVGRFAPSQTVEIRPRVSGAITEIHFHDGDIVKKGQLLFVVDPRPFDAAFDEARAGTASAQSAVVLARSDLSRAARLTGDEAMSASEIDALRAKVQSAEANLEAAQARQTASALNVEFTQVRSPINGRISDRRVDVGNLVSSDGGGSATLLTTVNALDPIYFTFDASEALYLKAQRQHTPGSPAPVAEIKLEDETGYAWKGAIDFTDNGLDVHSGTIRGRAVLANPKFFLTPGMFGNMRLAGAGKTEALLVPDGAVQTDEARRIVLVVGADNTIAAVPVEVGPVIDGLRIIRSGLAPDAKVVIGGLPFATPGSAVQPHLATFTADPESDVPASEPESAQATFSAQ